MRYIVLSILFLVTPSFSQVRVGVLTDLSGKGAFLGEQSLFGAKLAVEELNAVQPEASQNIELVVGDSKLDPTTALTEATKMITADKVVAILSDHTPTSVAISGIAAKYRILQLYQAPALSPLKTNPYALKTFLDYVGGCESIAKKWRDAGITKVAHLKVNFEFGELCLRGAVRVFPNQLVVPYNSGDDLLAAITLLKAKGAEAIFQTGYEVDSLNRIKALGQLNFAPKVATPEPLMTPMVIEQLRERNDETVTFGFPKLSERFIAQVKAKDSVHSLNNIESAAIAYMHIRLLAQAIKRCGQTDPDCLVKEIASSSVASVGPEMPLVGFSGYVNREAKFPIELRVWKGAAVGKSSEAETTPTKKISQEEDGSTR